MPSVGPRLGWMGHFVRKRKRAKLISLLAGADSLGRELRGHKLH